MSGGGESAAELRMAGDVTGDDGRMGMSDTGEEGAICPMCQTLAKRFVCSSCTGNVYVVNLVLFFFWCLCCSPCQGCVVSMHAAVLCGWSVSVAWTPFLALVLGWRTMSAD